MDFAGNKVACQQVVRFPFAEILLSHHVGSDQEKKKCRLFPFFKIKISPSELMPRATLLPDVCVKPQQNPKRVKRSGKKKARTFSSEGFPLLVAHLVK